MESREVKTKSGKTVYLPVMTESEYLESRHDDAGFCIACGADAYGVEPDARGYTCESCDAHKVYGTEELLLMGYLKIQ